MTLHGRMRSILHVLRTYFADETELSGVSLQPDSV